MLYYYEMICTEVKRMSLKGTKKLEKNRYELEIVIGEEEFAKAVNKAYRENINKMNVPGFRKGKAPKAMIDKMYGESVFYEDALNILYPDAVGGAIEESGLEYVDDKMDFDMVSIGKEGAHFKVVITVAPEVKLGKYKGIEVEKKSVSVTAKEVQEEIDRLADRNSRMISVEDRAAVVGDTTVIDFEGSVDGVAFDGGKAEAFSLQLGSGQFIPGFEEQIVGHNTGDEFDVEVTFPEEYQADNLAGKPAVFKVKLNEIKVKELPDIDDEFAKDVSEFDTLDELKKDLKAKALERKKKTADEEVETAILNKIVDSIKADIPEAMIINRVNQMVQDFAYRLQMQGMDIDNYMKFTGSNKEEFTATFRPQAEKQVKMRLALEQVVKDENIVATEEEIIAQIEKMAKDYNVTVEQVKQSVPDNEIAKDLAVNKAIDFIKSNAIITDAKANKAAAKKSTEE